MKNRKYIKSVFFIGVFLFFFLFYTRISPIVIFDMDDWFNLVIRRDPWPVWQSWNPSRILPETLIPLTAEFGGYCIYPLVHSFRRAIELAMALVISGMVTLYAVQFYLLAAEKWKAGTGLAVCYTFFFLLFHFMVFRTQSNQNDHLLKGYKDTDVFFYYLIPALLNGTLILFFIRKDYLAMSGQYSLLFRGLIVLAVYFALFSNIFQSGMLACYTGYSLFEVVVHSAKEKKNFRAAVRQIRPHLCILMTWLVALFFEFFGGRSAQKREQGIQGLMNNMIDCLKILKARLWNINSLFLLIFVTLVVGCLLGILWRKINGKKGQKQSGEKETAFAVDESIRYLALGILMLGYIFLVCSFSLETYIQRGDVLIGSFFFIFLFALCQIMRVNKACKSTVLIIPLLIVICFFHTMTNSRTFQTAVSNDLSAEIAGRVTDDMIDQIVEADRKGQTETILYVPAFKPKTNWPISEAAEYLLPETLYKYHVTENLIRVKMKLSTDKNREFGIPVP